MRYKIILIVIIQLLNVCFVFADILPNKAKLLQKDSEELLSVGDRYLNNKELEKAIEVYSIICNRSKTVKTEEEIENCCKAYVNIANIYLTSHSDFSKANEYITKAEDLQVKANKSYTFVYSAISRFYHLFALTTDDSVLMRKALDYSKKAFDLAIKENNSKEADIYVRNMIILSSNLEDLSLIDEVFKTYKNENSYAYKYNKLYYMQNKLFFEGDYLASAHKGEEMLKLSSDSTDYHRILISYTSVINAYFRYGDFKKTLEYIGKEENLASKLNLKEDLLALTKAKEYVYRKMEDNKTADSLANYYVFQKECLLPLTKEKDIYRSVLDSENTRMENEISKITNTNKKYYNNLIFVSAFVILLSILFFMLFIKHRRLKKSNLKKFNEYSKLLKKNEEQLYEMRLQLSKLEESSTDTTSDLISNEEKLKTLLLSDYEKKKLLDKILCVMDNVEEICSEDFSLNRLAKLTDSNSKYVSIVINENFDCNFNNFLNEYRVKEACRRLSNAQEYGMYTIDSISQGLGFKSKTTLNNAFKKIVGLTPSQYRKIASDTNK